MILVTGATGTNGTEVLKLLASRGIPAQAMVRAQSKTEAIADLPGIELVEGDFDESEALDSILAGIERVFLLTNSTECAEAQQLGFVEAARRSGVQHIVKLSQLAADTESPVRFLRYHAAVEGAIRDSGMTYTFLRPNLFMQGLLLFRDPIVQKGQFFAPIGDAKVSVVDTRDIAASAVAALTETGHEDKIYTLTGPKALTHAEMADGLSQALGRQITFVDVPEEAMREALIGVGMPAWQREGLLEDYAHYRRGEAAAIETGVVDATGKPPRSFTEFARDYAGALQPDK